MSGFWSCGPFKELEDRLADISHKAERMRLFLEILEESAQNQKLLDESTSEQEKLLASLAKLDIDKRMNIILGVPENGSEEKDDEILREILLKRISEGPEE